MKITTYKNNNKNISMFLLHATISYAIISVIANTTIIASASTLEAREESSVAAAGAAAERAPTKPACEHSTEMWGDVNPNIFYICDASTHTPQQLYCPEGRGFFKGLGYFGCIPYEQWPACISAESGGSNGNGGSQVVALCDTEHLTEPWETMNPNKFFMCQAVAREPLLMNCETGRGFVSVAVPDGRGGSSKVVGCTEWVKWRAYMNCAQFY